MMMLQKKNFSRWLRTLLSTTNAKKHNRGTQARAGRKMLVESLERREVFAADFASVVNFGSASGSMYQYAIEADAAGNSYATGVFKGTVDFDPIVDRTVPTDILTSANGTEDGFIAKYAPDNTLLWARKIGSNAVSEAAAIPWTDGGSGVVLDSSGNVYVSGYFTGTMSLDAYTLTSTGQSDAFLAKLDSNGNFNWARGWGSASFAEKGSDVALDPSGNIVVCGTPFFVGTGGVGFGYGGMVIRKYTPSGGLTWGQLMQNNSGGTASMIATDSYGNVLVGGSFRGTADFDPSAKKTYNVTGDFTYNNQYILRLSSAGAFQSVVTLNATSPSTLGFFNMDVDAANNVYVTGSYKGDVDFDSSSQIKYMLPSAPTTGDSTGFVAKLKSTGQWDWATSIGQAAYPRGISVDASGIYLAGSFYGAFSPSSTQPAVLSNGSSDIFVAQLSNNGQVQWSTTFGGFGSDYSYSIATNDGNIYISGYFSGTVDFDPDPIATKNLTSAGQRDAFLLRLRKR